MDFRVIAVIFPEGLILAGLLGQGSGVQENRSHSGVVKTGISGTLVDTAGQHRASSRPCTNQIRQESVIGCLAGSG